MNKYTTEQVTKVKQMLQNGATYAEIEKKTKVKKHSINYYSARNRKERTTQSLTPRTQHKLNNDNTRKRTQLRTVTPRGLVKRTEGGNAVGPRTKKLIVKTIYNLVQTMQALQEIT